LTISQPPRRYSAVRTRRAAASAAARLPERGAFTKLADHVNPIAHLLLATGVFVATHFVSGTGWRTLLVRRLGERGYLGLYSLVALATLVWMIWAYARAPVQPLWQGWRYLPALVMPVACVLLVAGYFSRNPTMVMQEGALKSSDPARGIVRITRHPLMWAIMLWAGAHVLARADVGALVFFGSFFLLGALGTVSMDRRKAAALGGDWKRFAAATSNVPFVAIAQRRNTLALGEIGWRKPLIGLALYAALFVLHPLLFGARPY
jgi:uncharacterized membrane protein